MFKKIDIHKIMTKYNLPGEIMKLENFGYGHINKTIKITTQDENGIYEYILQQINTDLFKNIKKLMSNINNVSMHLKEKIKNENHITKEVLTIVKTKKGKTYCKIGKKYYRIYDYIKNSICLQLVENNDAFMEVGKAYGEFEKDLADFNAKKLFNILPNFHNTEKRFNDYLEAYNKDVCLRKRNITQIHNQILKRESYARKIVDLEKNGLLPIRVAHNDTKINNIILDETTLKPLAILDLDTVLPSTLLYDYGDAIRYGCNKLGEEETKINKINFDVKLFESFTKGYLEEVNNIITEIELENLVYAPLVITYELCLRFLTEYLNGDTFFKSKYEGQNLVRAKVQMKLLIDMEKNIKEMKKIINKYSK